MSAPRKFNPRGWGGLASALKVDKRVRMELFYCPVYENGVFVGRTLRTLAGYPPTVAILEQLCALVEKHPDSAKAPVEVLCQVRELLVALAPLVRKGSVSGLLSKWEWKKTARRYRIFKAVSKFSLWKLHSDLLNSLVTLTQGRSIPEMPAKVQLYLFELLRRAKILFAEALRQGEPMPVRKSVKGEAPSIISLELYGALLDASLEGA